MQAKILFGSNAYPVPKTFGKNPSMWATRKNNFLLFDHFLEQLKSNDKTSFYQTTDYCTILYCHFRDV